MKKYKKVDDKIVVEETAEREVDVSSINSRIETLDKAILSLEKDAIRLGEQTNTYENEKKDLEKELKEIKKLK